MVTRARTIARIVAAAPSSPQNATRSLSLGGAAVVARFFRENNLVLVARRNVDRIGTPVGLERFFTLYVSSVGFG